MAAAVHRPISSPRDTPAKSTALIATLLLRLTFPPAAAQKPSTLPEADGGKSYNTSVSLALAILVVAIVSAFFLFGFFFHLPRRCGGDNSAVVPAMIAGFGGELRGLDSHLLEKFPTIVHSLVKAQKLGKESLDCAVCLCEFEDDDILRLLPRCSHVYHQDCVDVWFTTHVTCPVCRSNLSAGDEDPQPETADLVAISVEQEEVVNGEEQHPDLEDLVPIGSQRRETRCEEGCDEFAFDGRLRGGCGRRWW